MTVFHKAVAGFNHNIRHKGKAYHVQTEDSGVNNPHIVTHLFVGGTIVASKKSSYAESLGMANLAGLVRQLMEEQHKSMLRSLLAGAYDAASEQVEGRSFAPGEVQLEPPEPPPPAAPARRATPPAREPTPVPPLPVAPPRVQQAPSPTPLPPPVPGFNHNVRHKGKPYHVQTEDSGVANPHIITHLFTGGTIIASKKTSYAELLGAADLPEIVRELMEEQHKAILRILLSGAYESASADAQKRSFAPSEIQLEAPGAPLQPGVATRAPARPVSPPPPQVPKKKPKSLFGEDLLSEKSLDEVILAYLADDES